MLLRRQLGGPDAAARKCKRPGHTVWALSGSCDEIRPVPARCGTPVARHLSCIKHLVSNIWHVNHLVKEIAQGLSAPSRHHDVVTSKQTTVRLSEELAEQAETVARVRGTSVNALMVDALTAEIERVRTDKDFTARTKKLLERDKQLLERLAQWPATSHSPSTSGSPSR